MSTAAFAVVLFAAALHATWNAIVKASTDKLMTTALVAGSAAVMAATILPFLAPPSSESWPFIVASTALQIVYFVLVAHTYRVADMSQTYPLMRGTAPLLVAIVGAVLLGEHLSPPSWLGIAVICAGILVMAVFAGRAATAGVRFALLNALVIAGYTLIDGAGVRRSEAPAAYALWIFLLTGIGLVPWIAWTRRGAFRRYVGENWQMGLIGGIGTSASYGLALWVMTLAPVAVVAALRETSILFGTLIAGLFLRERLTPVRIGAAGLIALGAIVLRLA